MLLNYPKFILTFLCFLIPQFQQAQHIQWDTLTFPKTQFGFSQGQTVPNLQFEDVFGTSFMLYDRMESLVLLDFWFIACKPCIRNKRYLASFDRQYPIEIISISVDDRASTVKKYINEKGIRWTNVQDDHPTNFNLKSQIGHDNTYPDYILIGPDKKVIQFYDSGEDIGKLAVYLQEYFGPALPEKVDPTPRTGNLVPNPSFEDSTTQTMRWSGTQMAFNRNIRNWTSPTGGSPDVLHEDLLGQMFPPRPLVNLAPYKPRTGSFMLGIKTYGCATMTLHCKEYIQVQLSETLIPGNRYDFEFWIRPIAPSVRIDKLGIAVSDTLINQMMNPFQLELEPVGRDSSILMATSDQWYRASGSFIAPSHANYLIIGSFLDDSELNAIQQSGGLDYGFYLIDDVGLYPNNPETETRIQINSDILFEFDKSTLLTKAFPKIDEVYEQLNANPSISAEIQGHTDNIGSTIYNLELSKRRANAVQNYLLKKGITPDRLSAIGFGSEQPIESNDSVEGRQKNRRVEIVLK